MLKIPDIQNLYKKYNVSASKRFGQNFLIDEEILNKITNLIDLKNKSLIEIGPGLGSLSLKLLEKAKDLTSYEIDKDMIKVLKNEIQNEKFNLIEGDFLKQKLDFQDKKILIANIPYNITSDILFKLFKNSNKFSNAIIMVQKEVAERLVSKIGSKNYGKLAISAKHFTDIQYEFSVPSNCFFPSPKIDSAIISLKFKDKNFNDSKDFLNFIKKCFSMRRKTLFNNLKIFLDKEKAKKVIFETGLKENIRPQEISYKIYLKIFNNIMLNKK